MKLIRIPILSFAAALLAVLLSANAAFSQTYGGQATAVRSTVTVVGEPVVTTAVTDTGPLPAAGGNISLTSVGVTLPGVVSVGSSNSTTMGIGDTAQSTASVDNVNIGVLSNTITADVVSSQTSAVCPGPQILGSSTITNLSINGSPVTVTGAPNQGVTIFLDKDPVGTLLINEQIVEERGITVNALHLFVTDPISLTTTDLIIASARSSINCFLAPFENIYSGRGTGVTIFESDILTGTVSTIISDTGPLPMSGGNINTTTTGAGLDPLLSTGVVTASTSGGIPGGDVDTAQSNATTEDLIIEASSDPLNSLLITADSLISDTQCACSLSVGSCEASSLITNLQVSAVVAGIPTNVVIVITGEPNQVVDVLGLATLTLNGRSGSPSGNPAFIDAFAMRVDLNVVGLVGTSITISETHSDIVCLVAPTSAGATIAGRVADEFGRGLPRALVTLTRDDGVIVSTMTNNFGNYRFETVASGRTYVIQPMSRQYSFQARSITVDEDLAGVDFIPVGSGSVKK
jgi:hypothetical protein